MVQNSIQRKTSGMKSAKKPSRITPSNRSKQCTAKLEEAILYIERNSELVKSFTYFPYIVNSL
jgi:hypothetical protein